MQYEKTRFRLKLIDSIHEWNEELPAIMFIRHGDRNKIPDGEFGNEVELNETGFARARDLGVTLARYRINRLFTSPIIRCVQTAMAISAGCGKEIPVEPSTLLGDPGAFVNDGHAAGQTYMRLGFRKFYQDLLNGVPLDGNLPIVEGAGILTNFFRQTSELTGLNIYVSHDMIVALYAYATFGKKYEPDVNWVKYLGGLIFQLENHE